MDKCHQCGSEHIITLPDISGTQCLACDDVVEIRSSIPVGVDVELCNFCGQITAQDDMYGIGDDRICVHCRDHNNDDTPTEDDEF